MISLKICQVETVTSIVIFISSLCAFTNWDHDVKELVVKWLTQNPKADKMDEELEVIRVYRYMDIHAFKKLFIFGKWFGLVVGSNNQKESKIFNIPNTRMLKTGKNRYVGTWNDSLGNQTSLGVEVSSFGGCRECVLWVDLRILFSFPSSCFKPNWKYQYAVISMVYHIHSYN